MLSTLNVTPALAAHDFTGGVLDGVHIGFDFVCLCEIDDAEYFFKRIYDGRLKFVRNIFNGDPALDFFDCNAGILL